MKKPLLLILILAVFAVPCAWATAEVADEDAQGIFVRDGNRPANGYAG